MVNKESGFSKKSGKDDDPYQEKIKDRTFVKG